MIHGFSLLTTFLSSVSLLNIDKDLGEGASEKKKDFFISAAENFGFDLISYASPIWGTALSLAYPTFEKYVSDKGGQTSEIIDSNFKNLFLYSGATFLTLAAVFFDTFSKNGKVRYRLPKSQVVARIETWDSIGPLTTIFSRLYHHGKIVGQITEDLIYDSNRKLSKVSRNISLYPNYQGKRIGPELLLHVSRRAKREAASTLSVLAKNRGLYSWRNLDGVELEPDFLSSYKSTMLQIRPMAGLQFADDELSAVKSPRDCCRLIELNSPLQEFEKLVKEWIRLSLIPPLTEGRIRNLACRPGEIVFLHTSVLEGFYRCELNLKDKAKWELFERSLLEIINK